MDKAARYRNEFYLVDGDLDELVHRDTPKDYRLYRLPRYDIESFLVEEAAIAAIAEEQEPRRNVEYYIDRIKFEEWQRNVIDLVDRLVACFAVLHVLERETSDGGANIGRFVEGDECLPDSGKIDRYIDLMCVDQTIITEEEFRQKLLVTLKNMGRTYPQRLRWISGKQILLPLVIRLLRRETRRNVSLDSLRFRLVGYCELVGLRDLKKRVLRLRSVTPRQSNDSNSQ